MRFLHYIPFIGLVIVAYNLAALLTVGLSGAGGVGHLTSFLSATLFAIPMVSHESWILTVGDLFVIAGIATLLQQIIKATHVDSADLVNQGLSMGVFVVALVEFLLLPGFATSTFFILLLMTLIDIMGGFLISVSAARRDIEVTRG
jgi:hypothetical protein